MGSKGLLEGTTGLRDIARQRETKEQWENRQKKEGR